MVLSHFDLGVIESITEFPRGSRRSPKVGIVSQNGKFLLKRRSAARAQPERVRFAHRVQSCLTGVGFPAAKLIPARDGAQLVQLREQVYELFEFVAGQPFRQTTPETYDAGLTLALFHKATEDFAFSATVPPPSGDYHDALGVRTGLSTIGLTLSSHDSFSGDEAELASLIQFLFEVYDRSAETVNGLGFTAWPQRVIHADWHPGNLLFRNQRVVAVLDYDSVRRSRSVVDVGNGALQFSMLAGGDPSAWPDHLDEERLHGFLAGYESLRSLSNEERTSIPHLMAEALIAECVPPITETGSVGQWAGFRILQMVRRKLTWLRTHGERLVTAA